MIAKQLLVTAFNEWMRRYIDAPNEFSRELEAVTQYLKESESGVEPSYGHAAAEYLSRLIGEREGTDAGVAHGGGMSETFG